MIRSLKKNPFLFLEMGERRELNPRMVDSQSTALIHLATSAPLLIYFKLLYFINVYYFIRFFNFDFLEIKRQKIAFQSFHLSSFFFPILS